MILISILIAIGQRKTGHSDTKRYPKAPVTGVPTPLWGGVTPLIARRVSGAKDWAAPHHLPCQEQACERRANRIPDRRKSAVRACRARHRSDRGRLRRVQAADHDVVLRDQRSRHVSAGPHPGYGRAGPRNLGYSVRQGTGARAAGGGRGRGNLLRRRAATGSEYAIVAIVVGLLVGSA